jgi:predicted transposase YdaD
MSLNLQAGRQAGRQAGKQAGRQAGRHAGRQAGRQASREPTLSKGLKSLMRLGWWEQKEKRPQGQDQKARGRIGKGY